MLPASALVLRVLLQRGQRASEAPLLAPIAPIASAATDAARRRADQLIKTGFILRRNPVWKPSPPINWGHNPRKDVNWHYRINTFEPVELLLHAYRSGAGHKYFALSRRVALDWIDYNLVRDLPNQKKWHDMAAALRARVFAQILDTELRLTRPNWVAVASLAWALEEHARFLADPKNLPRGNHAVFMMWGLASVVRALPELREAAAYRRYFTDQLRTLVRSQFAADGFHLEHSPEYHLFVTETFADMVENQLVPALPELSDVVQRARSHFHELLHPNGDLAMLGDSERRVDERYLPLRTPANTDGSQLRVYPDSGYAMFRSQFGANATPRDDYFVLGAGHHSLVHKHADHLSFEWSFRGTPILVDSGKGSYNPEKWWKRFFRSTRAGNAVEIDSRSHGKTPRDGRGRIIGWREADGVVCVIARYYSDNFDVTQTRALVASSGQYLLVVDRLEGKAPHAYRQWFHLHELLNFQQRDGYLQITDADGRSLLAMQELTGQASIEALKGEAATRRQGWVSPAYMELVPRHSVAYCKTAASADCVALFAAEPALAPEVLAESGSLRVRWYDASGRVRGVQFGAMTTNPTIEQIYG